MATLGTTSCSYRDIKLPLSMEKHMLTSMSVHKSQDNNITIQDEDENDKLIRSLLHKKNSQSSFNKKKLF